MQILQATHWFYNLLIPKEINSGSSQRSRVKRKDTTEDAKQTNISVFSSILNDRKKTHNHKLFSHVSSV